MTKRARPDNTSIRVTPETRRQLKKLQLANGHRSLEETLQYLVVQHKLDLFKLVDVKVEVNPDGDV